MAEYPPLPRVPDLSQPAKVCVAWVIAAEHEEMIDALCGFGRWYWPAAGELTTGCTCRDAPGWYPGRPDDPTCPSEPVAKPDTQPCTCQYVLMKVAGAPGPWESLRLPGVRRQLVLTRCFLIRRNCPHHGDAAAWAFQQQYADGMNRLVDLVLDEREKC